MRRLLHLLLVAGALAAAAACGSREPAEPRITGFDGLPWGTTRDTLVAAKGEMLEEVDESGGVHRLRYADTLHGEPAFVDYFVDLWSEGLMGGAFHVDAPTPGACASVYSVLRRSLEARYPDLPSDRVGGKGMAGFCGGPQGAFTGLRWDDPANGAVVVLGRIGGDRWISVEYVTPALRGWRAAREEHRSKARF